MTESYDPNDSSTPGIEHFIEGHNWTWILLLTWTVLISVFIIIANVFVDRHYTNQLYREIEAANARDLLFRSWNAKFNGIYLPYSDESDQNNGVRPNGIKPNPYLKHPKRDVVTQAGDKLTLVNPAWMTRMISEMQNPQKNAEFPVSTLTSDKLVNPKNAPDEWEKKAMSFLGQREANEFFEISSEKTKTGKYLVRFARPLIVSEGCLVCHGDHEYKVGDIRGIISTKMAADSTLLTRNKALVYTNIVGILIWIFGLCGIFIFRRSLRRYEAQNALYFEALQEKERVLSEHRNRLAALVADRTRELVVATERNQLMLEGVPLTCGLFNERLEMFDCNQKTVEQFELSTKEETCRRILELFPPCQPNGESSLETAQRVFAEAFETGYYQLEWYFQLPSGEMLPTEVTLVRVVHQQNEKIIAAYTRDLRKEKAEKAAKIKQEQLTDALNQIARQLMSFEATTSFETVIWNVFNLLGTAAEVDRVYIWKNHRDMRGRLCCTQIHEWSLGAPPQHGTDLTVDIAYEDSSPTWEHLLASGECVNNLVHLMPPAEQAQLAPQGILSILVAPIMFQDDFWGFIGFDDCTHERIWDLVEVNILKSAGGVIAGAIARKQLETSLYLARDEAESSNRAKSEFLATMSHEIRTPLNGVIGFSDLLLGTELTAKQNEYTQLIKISGESLLALINDILDFSKIETDKFEVQQDDFDIVGAVESTVGMLAPRAEEKHIELCVQFTGGLPRTLKGDVGRVRQILLNLIGNAIKFTEVGYVQVVVSPEKWEGNKIYIRFTITDTGIGIPADKMDRLFKTFSQMDTSYSRLYGGAGLGLAISKKLVQLMGGIIDVESEQGKGSTFWFQLPFFCHEIISNCLQNRHFQCLEHRSLGCYFSGKVNCTGTSYLGFSAGLAVKDKQVLIVSSCSVLSSNLSNQLSTWKMDVHVVSSIEMALESVQKAAEHERPIDLIFVDEEINGESGNDVVKKICASLLSSNNTKQKPIKTPGFIVLVPFDSNVNQSKLETDSEQLYFLPKPIFLSPLLDAVMTMLYHQSWLTYLSDFVTGNSALKKNTGQIEAQPLQEELPAVRPEHFHVLIAEDNKINQIVIQNILREAGFPFEIVVNGKYAYEAAISGKFDLILMDCQMPEMDGYEATQLIRKWESENNKPRLPIIALTANVIKEDVQKCYDVGMDAFCSKPIAPAVLFEEINGWITKKRTGSIIS
ncbi:MAG: ATP-binding protein [Thermoguttaceae bacterium]